MTHWDTHTHARSKVPGRGDRWRCEQQGGALEPFVLTTIVREAVQTAATAPFMFFLFLKKPWQRIYMQRRRRKKTACTSFEPGVGTARMCGNRHVVKGTVSATERLVSAPCLPVNIQTHADPLARMWAVAENNSSAQDPRRREAECKVVNTINTLPYYI